MVGPICASAPGPRRAHRRAFTLAELAVSLGVVSVVVVALGSAVVVASHAVPTTHGAASEAAAAGMALDALAGEVRYATEMLEASAHALEFHVADRDGDGQPETIRYEWSGTPGDPLLRAYNGKAPAVVVPGLEEFEFAYDRTTHTSTQSVATTQSSGEMQFTSFGGFPTLSLPSTHNASLSSTGWACQSFQIDKVAFPEDVEKVRITRALLRLRRASSGGPTLSVGIHRRVSSGSWEPASAPIGTPVNLAIADVPSSYALVEVRFNDVVIDPTDRDLSIVIKGTDPTCAQLQYQGAVLAGADTRAFLWSTNGGSTWQPATSNRNTYDAVFAVYGEYDQVVQQDVAVQSYTLNAVEVSALLGGSPPTRLQTRALTVNEPEIDGP